MPITNLGVRDRDAYLLRSAGQSWASIVRTLGFNNESTARLAASRYATQNNQPPLTSPNPRRSQAGRVAAFARFNRPQTIANQILNRQTTTSPRTRRSQIQNTERTFGVEIEYVNMSRHTVAIAVANALGVAHIHVLPYHGTVCEVCHMNIGSAYSQWKVERDGSVSTGGEVVSPILSGADGLEQVKKVAKAVKLAGGGISRSCGLHVHLGVKDLSPQQRVNLIDRWYATYPSVKKFVARNRWSSHYCSMPTVGELAQWKTAILAGNDPDRNHAVRTRSLNITNFKKTGTYEVRLHQGSLNTKKITTWIKFLVAFAEFGSQDNAFENPTNEEFGFLNALTKPMLNKTNLFTENEANYLKQRSQALQGAN